MAAPATIAADIAPEDGADGYSVEYAFTKTASATGVTYDDVIFLPGPARHRTRR